MGTGNPQAHEAPALEDGSQSLDLEKILKVAVMGGASDLILKTGAVPRFRHRGELVNLSDGQVITPIMMQSWIDVMLPAHLSKRLQATGDADFAFQSKSGYRFRVNLFRQRQTFGMVLRVVATHIKSLEELQLPAILKELTLEKRGLILVTGATGSGKSTTLAAMIQRINQERAAHIITIEDPIEFNFKDERSTINQREIGIDSDSFSNALRGAMRQNPDVILVGELRDQETTETALKAAETGHLVMSTLHTIDAVESMTRLMSYFPPHQHATIRQLVGGVLKAVVSQRLVPKVDGTGMTAANEILINNATVREIILKGENFASLRNAITDGGDTYGMQTFDDSLLALYQAGIISREDALAESTRRDDLLLQIRGVGN